MHAEQNRAERHNVESWLKSVGFEAAGRIAQNAGAGEYHSGMSIETCLACGEEFAVPENDVSSGMRKPCPKCGSFRRTASMAMNMSGRGDLHADLLAVPYENVLLEMAQRLASEEQMRGLAVIVAHTACEIVTQRVIKKAFEQRGVPELQEIVWRKNDGHNLANLRLKELYKALSGDQIDLETFWPEFKNSVDRRNDVVHGGKYVSKDEADRSVRATTALVAHLKKRFP